MEKALRAHVLLGALLKVEDNDRHRVEQGENVSWITLTCNKGMGADLIDIAVTPHVQSDVGRPCLPPAEDALHLKYACSRIHSVLHLVRHSDHLDLAEGPGQSPDRFRARILPGSKGKDQRPRPESRLASRSLDCWQMYLEEGRGEASVSPYLCLPTHGREDRRNGPSKPRW